MIILSNLAYDSLWLPKTHDCNSPISGAGAVFFCKITLWICLIRWQWLVVTLSIFHIICDPQNYAGHSPEYFHDISACPSVFHIELRVQWTICLGRMVLKSDTDLVFQGVIDCVNHLALDMIHCSLELVENVGSLVSASHRRRRRRTGVTGDSWCHSLYQIPDATTRDSSRKWISFEVKSEVLSRLDELL